MNCFSFCSRRPPPQQGYQLMTTSITLMLAGEPLTLTVANEPAPDYADAPEASSNDGAFPVLHTVGELRSLITENTKFDGETMKLIYKGRMLSNDANEHLSKYTFQNGDKVMGLGKQKVVPVEDKGLQALRKYEKDQLVKLGKTYDELKADMAMLEQNFLSTSMTHEMITKLWKRVLQFNDTSEKHLIAIDAIQIFDDDTPDNMRQRNREVRKTMINGIQDYLNFNDKFKFRLEQLKDAQAERERN
uniref:Ubiquitin-like domain-containing protein n=1 Tax=Panagrellus redivivus TaxID=6233 RepID=A0A7E4UXZ7_PANRE